MTDNKTSPSLTERINKHQREAKMREIDALLAQRRTGEIPKATSTQKSSGTINPFVQKQNTNVNSG
jgi:hypothetical protein